MKLDKVSVAPVGEAKTRHNLCPKGDDAARWHMDAKDKEDEEVGLVIGKGFTDLIPL
jgi:hypothetical protein